MIKKAVLKKPYEDDEKSDFIVKNNHVLGYEIRETDSALEAWGMTAKEEAEAIAKAENEAEIMAQKSYLSSTDWCVIKCLELGLDMETAYPEVFAGRQSARAKINLLEGK